MTLHPNGLEQFRKDFFNQYVKKTHESRAMNKRATTAANNLCISQPIRNILIEETNAMHNEGRKLFQ